ncbi:MAG: FAD-binding protein [Clostridiales bacterium]|nr:FAD-binding protein [Clostridiales bacterium]
MAKITTDLLVIGGSLAGLAAAITAKEANPDMEVTIVEKYTCGYAGKANRGGGVIDMMVGDPEDYVQYHVHHIGEYLNNQDALRQYATNLNHSIDILDKWTGGKMQKNPDGSYITLKWLSRVTGEKEDGKYTFDEPENLPWTLTAIELDFLPPMKKYAQKAGIKFIDRTGIVDFLKDGERISGAVGYNIDTEEQTVFACKAIVLASGGQNYRIMPMWSPGRGEGTAAAWRAGAKMSNCEFASFYNWISLDHYESSMGVEFCLYNDKGENVGKVYTEGAHPDIDARSLAECYKQVMAGNGPMHYHAAENPLMDYLGSVLGCTRVYDRPYADDFWGRLFFNAMTQQTNDHIVPGLIGECSPLWVDLNFATSIPGLYAAGDVCYGGSGTAGAVPPPPGRVRGSGLAFAQYSGCMCGPNAAAYVAGATQGAIDEAQVAAVDERFMAPKRNGGTIKVMDFLPEIHKVVQPLGNSIWRSEERINKAIERIEELKVKSKDLVADDAHTLFGCNEIQSMLISAELFFRTSLQREESRGWFLREDYQERSDKPEWIVVQKDGDGMCITKEPLPMDTYKYQQQ